MAKCKVFFFQRGICKYITSSNPFLAKFGAAWANDCLFLRVPLLKMVCRGNTRTMTGFWDSLSLAKDGSTKQTDADGTEIVTQVDGSYTIQKPGGSLAGPSGALGCFGVQRAIPF